MCSYFFAKNLALGENFLSPTLNIIQPKIGPINAIFLGNKGKMFLKWRGYSLFSWLKIGISMVFVNIQKILKNT